MKHVIFTTVSLILSSLFAINAQTVVMDKETNTPLPKASIFDNTGRFIAITTDEGMIPDEISSLSYPLVIRYLGYENAIVSSPEEEAVFLIENDYELPELTVDDTSRTMLHLTGYVRYYGTGTTDQDTVMSFSESIVDFMLPRQKKTKFKGWKDARVLASRNYHQRISNTVDTIAYSEQPSGPSGGSYFIDDEFEIPQEIKSGKSNRVIINGKYSPERTWVELGDTYFLEIDDLADSKNHKESPNALKLLGATVDFNKVERRYKFEKNQEKIITPEDLKEMSYAFEMLIRGKLFRKMIKSKDPINLNAYAELYIIDREYITEEEAKDLKKNPPQIKASSIKAPANAPQLHPELVKIKERVTHRD